MTDPEHVITVESTQVWRGAVGPENAERLTSDGSAVDALGREQTRLAVALELVNETKLTYECECGQRFRKDHTAREHLEQYRDDNTDTETDR